MACWYKSLFRAADPETLLCTGFRAKRGTFQGAVSDVVSVSCFGVRGAVMFQFMFVHYTFSLVWAAEWPPFGK